MEVYKKLRLKEYKNKKYFEDNPTYALPYPHLDDYQLQKKLTLKKEFSYKYDGEIKDVPTHANIICKHNERFELSPHQEFIKRFISYQSPYNGVLLYHGLGSGKTCSAIGITESIRKYSKYIHNFKKIIIIASPNVQENFKLQLFDPSKLVKKNNNWMIHGCLGNSLIEELNVYQINSLTHEDLSQKIQRLVNGYYDFTGYIEFANRIQRCITVQDGGINERVTQKKLKSEFEDTLIVIDEIHNIRLNSDVKNDKKVAKSLYQLVQYVKYLKLVFLTGTPMYNDPKEIIFVLNILNMNDNRSIIGTREIFDENDDFIMRGDEEIGKQLFIMKANGYISYVRGENPYSFPYLITPGMYDDPHSIKVIGIYPRYQFNTKPITQPIKYLDLYVSALNETQEAGYNYFLDKVSEKIKDQEGFEETDSFGYGIIQSPIQALNIVYPEDGSFLTGNAGLKSVMNYNERQNPPSKNNFEYKRLKNMFSYEEIGKYSHKIKAILDRIINSKGIVLIYSGYIDGGIVPIALALEHIGFTRYGAKSKTLFKTKPYKDGDYAPMKKFTYSIICGEKTLSPDNNEEIEALTHNNINGEKIKVVMISQAGSEGIDLKNIRQVHILEPWYNMNRIEQIIGRARRNCSHKELPLEERNVEAFLHCTTLNTNIESMDMYLYRLSEKKSIKICKVSRVLKSVAVDCILNKEQQLFARMNQKIKLTLSDSKVIDYTVKDEQFTSLCDYSDECEYECINTVSNKDATDVSTYEYQFTQSNKVLEKIKNLFKIKHSYKRAEIDKLVKTKGIHIEEIERALHDLETDTLVDKFGKKGTIIHVLDLYFFQPIEINDTHVSMYERMVPIQVKDKHFSLDIEHEEIEDDNEVMSVFRDKYTRATEEHDQLKNEDDWYNFFNVGSEYLKKMGVSDDELIEHLIAHLCEQLPFQDEIILLNEAFNKDGILEKLIKDYYHKFIIHNDKIHAIYLIDVLSKDNNEHILVYDNLKWRESTYTERNIIGPSIKKKISIPKGPFFKIIGFMGLNKASNTFEFKIRDEEDTKSTGALVENKPKPAIISLLNTTINKAGAFNKINSHSKKKNELSVIEELLLRHYDKNNTKKARCFLNKLEFYYLNKN